MKLILLLLTAKNEKEVSWRRWLVEVEKDQKTLDVVIGAVEVFAAQLESGDTVDDVSDEVMGIPCSLACCSVINGSS